MGSMGYTLSKLPQISVVENCILCCTAAHNMEVIPPQLIHKHH